MQVKICGITRSEDAAFASRVGADALGLVFWPKSKRAVTLESAAPLCAAAGPFTTLTALLVNPESDYVQRLLESLPINLLQFHGDESPEFCEQWQFPYLRALRVEPGVDLRKTADRYPRARGFLLDAVHGGQFGGTGRTFDWQLIPKDMASSIVLAGGLDPDNVADAVSRIGPAAVDVSSGVESAPGVKDNNKVRRFVAQAKSLVEDTTSDRRHQP